MQAPGAPTANLARELLSFRLREQEFCIDITAVREIRGWTGATPLPHAPAFIRGVVNLRGLALPVIDLAARLDLGADEPTPQHVVIVAELKGQVVGLLVTAVCDIVTLDESAIQPTPDVASRLAQAYLHGLLTVGDRMVGLLRIDQLMPQTGTAAEQPKAA